MVMVLVPNFAKEGDDNIVGSFHNWVPGERIVDTESIIDFDRCGNFPKFCIGFIVDQTWKLKEAKKQELTMILAEKVGKC